MTQLLARYERAKADLEAIEREMAQATCREIGCDMRHVGGVNACCELERDCGCSVPLHECSRCGDCDYGDNDEATETRANCCARDAFLCERSQASNVIQKDNAK